MRRVFHIVLDEKFIDNAIEIFDSVPGIVNQYLLVSRFGVVSQIKTRKRLLVFNSQFARLHYVFQHRPDIVVLHSLFFGATLAPFVSRKAAKVWVSWGKDLYKDSAESFTSSYPFRHSLFMKETREWIASRKESPRKVLSRSAKALTRDVFRAAAIKRIGYVSTCLPYEFPVIREKYPHLKRFDFDYIDRTSPDLPMCQGRDILIGNSSSINCNHMDVFKIFRERDLPAHRVVVPLNYAGGAAYQDSVIKAGRESFGERFMPLTDFMGIEEYTLLLRECGFAVMGFLRQQATKTIQLLLFQGSKIFFFKDTDIYRHFKNEGYSVFSVEEDLTEPNLREKLSDQEQQRNRKLITEQFDYDSNRKNVTRSIEGISARGA